MRLRGIVLEHCGQRLQGERLRGVRRCVRERTDRGRLSRDVRDRRLQGTDDVSTMLNGVSIARRKRVKPPPPSRSIFMAVLGFEEMVQWDRRGASIVVGSLVVACAGRVVDGSGGQAETANGATASGGASSTGGNSAASGGVSAGGASQSGGSFSGGVTGGGGSTPEGGPGASCWFEPLGFWKRCAETRSGLDFAFKTRVECAQNCVATGCTSIVDYTWIAPDFGCAVAYGPCTPSTDISDPEDAALEYRYVCGSQAPSDAIFAFDDLPGIAPSATSPCRFESIGDFKTCENAVPYAAATATGKTLEDCLLACESRSDCVAVEDYWNPPGAYECTLHLSSCDAPAADTGGDTLFRFYKKNCGADQ